MYVIYRAGSTPFRCTKKYILSLKLIAKMKSYEKSGTVTIIEKIKPFQTRVMYKVKYIHTKIYN